MKYLFGPIPSRRLGISLGVDLVPLKVCSLNCVYCEVGRTTKLTLERQEYVPINDVIKELGAYLSQAPELDYITFSGQGEPTLNSGLGKVIDYIKDNYPRYKVAVLTNGTLFWDAAVRQEVLRADVLLPSLDGALEQSFGKICRPHRDLEVGRVIEGMVKLRHEYAGKIYLEVFLVPGINDSEAELQMLRQALLEIRPDLVQLNTLDRPGTEPWVKPLSQEKLEEIRAFFQPLKTEIIAKAQTRKAIRSFDQDITEQIIQTIKRRPCTDTDLCKILGLHINELNKYLSTLIADGKVSTERLDRGIFFKLSSAEDPT